MATFFDWTKLVVSNKLLLAMLLASVGSVGTNIGQLFGSYEQEEKHIKDVREVATAFQSAMVEIEPKEIIVRSNCGQCLNEVRKLREEFH